MAMCFLLFYSFSLSPVLIQSRYPMICIDCSFFFFFLTSSTSFAKATRSSICANTHHLTHDINIIIPYIPSTTPALFYTYFIALSLSLEFRTTNCIITHTLVLVGTITALICLIFVLQPHTRCVVTLLITSPYVYPPSSVEVGKIYLLFIERLSCRCLREWTPFGLIQGDSE